MGEVIHGDFGDKPFRVARVLRRIREAATQSKNYRPAEIRKFNDGAYARLTEREEIWDEITRAPDELEINKEE